MTFTLCPQASLAAILRIWYLGLDSSNGMPLSCACSSYRPSLKASPTACHGKRLSTFHNATISKMTNPKNNTFEIRRTSMIRGKSFKLFVISTIMTQRETVIRIEPPRKEAAPSRAYLQSPRKSTSGTRMKAACSKLYMLAI